MFLAQDAMSYHQQWFIFISTVYVCAYRPKIFRGTGLFSDEGFMQYGYIGTYIYSKHAIPHYGMDHT
jgi:hypothetical protein